MFYLFLIILALISPPAYGATVHGNGSGSGGGLASTDIDTCAEFAAIIAGETGTCGGVVLSVDPVITGSLNIPNGAAPTTDAFGEIAGDNNAWAAGRGAIQWFDGTANTYIIGALVSDAPANGECIKWNTGGTITWETCGSGSMATDTLWDVAGDLAYGTGSNTGGRLAIGTANQLLRVNAGATAPEWTSTLTGLTSISFGADPGDGSPLNLSNNTCINWEIATPGTDKCLKVNASDQLDFNGTLNLSGAATGSVVINGVTSGSFTITGADAMAQSVTATVAAQTSGATVLTIPDMAGVNDTFAFLAKSGTLTNKTVDCTTAGNVCTIYKYMQLDLVGVAGGTAGHVWNDDPLSTACTPGSRAGTNQTEPFCTFPDSDGEYGRQLKLSLPTGYVAGTLQFRVSWKTTGTGNFRPRLQTICYASDAANDSAYSNSTYITAAAGTSARFNQTAWTTATDTGCDAEETMAIRFSRNRTEGSDTLNSTADVEFVGVRYAVAQ